ncbi:hypothetical protein VTK73DRAFT_499 [Phialemonium thermophilum]|uniref:DUF4158 domain-containing protein n=1 Tax=Phialemonium thermophilum TaxID=223376 RepID=A0ABR3VUW7_9PEZI
MSDDILHETKRYSLDDWELLGSHSGLDRIKNARNFSRPKQTNLSFSLICLGARFPDATAERVFKEEYVSCRELSGLRSCLERGQYFRA